MPTRQERRAARHVARDSRNRTGSGFTRFARERPLLVVAAGIGLGMAFGALLPWKFMEDELLGERADKLKDGALELASDGYEKAKSVAQRGYEAATEMLRGSDGAVGSSDTASAGLIGESRAAGTGSYHN